MHRRATFKIILTAICLTLANHATAKTEVFEQYKDRTILKIAVLANGDVTAGGTEIEFNVLDPLFGELADAKGVVWYFRENPGNDAPPATASDVIDLIIKHRLPVCLSPTASYKNCRK